MRTPTSISPTKVLANGTIVTWERVIHNRPVLFRGSIQAYEYHDMPWKLYRVACEDGRIAFLHPDRVGRTYGPPHEVRV